MSELTNQITTMKFTRYDYEVKEKGFNTSLVALLISERYKCQTRHCKDVKIVLFDTISKIFGGVLNTMIVLFTQEWE